MDFLVCAIITLHIPYFTLDFVDTREPREDGIHSFV
jgi:hypothetical protein